MHWFLAGVQSAGFQQLLVFSRRASSWASGNWAGMNCYKGEKGERKIRAQPVVGFLSDARGIRTNEDYADLKRCLLIPKLVIFDSRVCRGMPSLVAAPDGPETRPPHSANAVSIISLS